MPTAAAAGPLLAVEGLTVRLPRGSDRDLAVEDVSFAVGRGEIVCLVGESGSGKSISAQAIMGLLPRGLSVQQGRIDFGGRDLTRLSRAERTRINGAEIAMIFQEPMATLNPVFTVRAQIDEVLRLHSDLTARQRRDRILALLDEVRLPDPARLMAAHPHQLSGGQCQRVMIAMALALEPKLLIADEPTTALDVTTQARILDLIHGLRSRHEAGILFITHDFGVVAEVADRVVVMRRGQVVEAGSVQQVLRQPEHPYTRSLIAAVPHGRPRPSRAVTAPPLLRAQGLRKTFGGRGGLFSRNRPVAALDDVALDLRRGETVGLVGESGSGKSTLARCILRLETIDAGVLELDGQDMRRLSGANLRRLRKRVQIVFQDPYSALNPRQKVGAAIAEGPIIHGVPAPEALARAAELLRLVELPESAAGRYPHEFSGGQRQRICIARALALEPDILVADEAVSALDVSVQAQIVRLLSDMRDRLNFALLFITHDLRLAAELCDRVVVMRSGAVVESGPTADVFDNPTHPYTRELLDAIPGQGLLALPGEGPTGPAAP